MSLPQPLQNVQQPQSSVSDVMPPGIEQLQEVSLQQAKRGYKESRILLVKLPWRQAKEKAKLKKTEEIQKIIQEEGALIARLHALQKEREQLQSKIDMNVELCVELRYRLREMEQQPQALLEPGGDERQSEQGAVRQREQIVLDETVLEKELAQDMEKQRMVVQEINSLQQELQVLWNQCLPEAFAGLRAAQMDLMVLEKELAEKMCALLQVQVCVREGQLAREEVPQTDLDSFSCELHALRLRLLCEFIVKGETSGVCRLLEQNAFFPDADLHDVPQHFWCCDADLTFFAHNSSAVWLTPFVFAAARGSVAMVQCIWGKFNGWQRERENVYNALRNALYAKNWDVAVWLLENCQNELVHDCAQVAENDKRVLTVLIEQAADSNTPKIVHILQKIVALCPEDLTRVDVGSDELPLQLAAKLGKAYLCRSILSLSDGFVMDGRLRPSQHPLGLRATCQQEDEVQLGEDQQERIIAIVAFGYSTLETAVIYLQSPIVSCLMQNMSRYRDARVRSFSNGIDSEWLFVVWQRGVQQATRKLERYVDDFEFFILKTITSGLPEREGASIQDVLLSVSPEQALAQLGPHGAEQFEAFQVFTNCFASLSFAGDTYNLRTAVVNALTWWQAKIALDVLKAISTTLSLEQLVEANRILQQFYYPEDDFRRITETAVLLMLPPIIAAEAAPHPGIGLFLHALYDKAIEEALGNVSDESSIAASSRLQQLLTASGGRIPALLKIQLFSLWVGIMEAKLGWPLFLQDVGNIVSMPLELPGQLTPPTSPPPVSTNPSVLFPQRQDNSVADLRVGTEIVQGLGGAPSV